MTEQEWEQYLHIQTTGHQQLFPADTHYHRYEATPYADFELLFSLYHPDPDASFLDFGCGKGRFNFFVAALGYPSIGIEMDPQLYALACSNRQQFSAYFPHATVDFSCSLAQDYAITAAQNCFYFFNPFNKRIFQEVVSRILTSYYEHPRAITIILYYPSQEYCHFLDDCTPFTQQLTVACHPHDTRHAFHIYKLSEFV